MSTVRHDGIVVFLKKPTAGAVKTRLAATIGAQRAADLYAQWVAEVLTLLQSIRPRTQVFGYFAGAEESQFSEWGALVDQWWPQPAGDLGDRLDRAFRRAHDEGTRKLLAIGTDCLELDYELLDNAFERLDSHKVVLGPTTDGGYYLVGLKMYIPGLFDRVRWSSPHTLDDQMRRCNDHGLTAALLPMRSDIDVWDDWLNHCQRTGRTP